MTKAKLKWFNAAKGYGFVTTEVDVFVHFSEINVNGRDTLIEDEEVEFTMEQKVTITSNEFDELNEDEQLEFTMQPDTLSLIREMLEAPDNDCLFVRIKMVNRYRAN